MARWLPAELAAHKAIPPGNSLCPAPTDGAPVARCAQRRPRASPLRTMEVKSLHRGRLLDHLQLVVRDLAASKRFYSAVFEALGVPLGGEGEDFFWADELFVSSRESKASSGAHTGRAHFAFQAKDRATVERAYRAGLAAGGADNGAPGERPYHRGYYAAFLLDPDGNNVEAVFHGPAERSAASVEINFKR